MTDQAAPGISEEPGPKWMRQPVTTEADVALAELIERLGARSLSDVSTDAPPPMRLDRLDPEGHTILYGTGGAGKGVLTTWWIAQLVRLGERVLILDYEGHATEWARRYAGLAGAANVERVLWVGPFTAAWQGRAGAIWKQKADIRALAEAFGATFVVIDSIVPACAGSDPMKPETAALYAAALEYIGRPALSIAHVTKAESLAYPFGSVFWHNLARVTWSLSRDGDQVILAHRKHNNYGALGRFVVTTTWHDGRPGEIWEQGYSAAMADRIDEVLGAESLTLGQITAQLAEEADEDAAAIKEDTVRKALTRGLRTTPKRFEIAGTGSTATWSRASGAAA